MRWSFTKTFFICRVSTFKVYAEGEGFTDYSLIIVAEINIIFRFELIRQMNSTAQKIKFSIKDFFSKCDQIRWKVRI